MVKYANWDAVSRRFTRVDAPEAGGGTDVAWTAWCVRRGPKEVARRQEAASIGGVDGKEWWYGVHLGEIPGPERRYNRGRVEISLLVLGQRDAALRAWHRQDANDWGVALPEPALLEAYVDAVLSDLRSMADWYLALAERERAKLPRMTFDEAKRSSDAWHRRLARLYMNRHGGGFPIWYINPMTGAPLANPPSSPVALSPAIGEGERFPVPGYPGHYWCRLETEDAFSQESARMSNCVGWGSTSYVRRYVRKAAPYPQVIWSLRCGDESLVTAEVVSRRSIIADFDGVPCEMAAKGLDYQTALKMLSTEGGRAGNLQGRRVRVENVRVDAQETREVVQALAAHNRPVPPKLAPAVDWLHEFVATPAEARAA